MTQFKHPFQDSLHQINQRLDELIKRTELRKQLPDDITLLDNTDIQRLFKISPSTATNWREEGVLPYHQIKNKIYYKLSDIKEVIKKHYIKKKV